MNSMTDLPLFYAPDIERTACLPPDESKHCTRVMRLTIGDHIKVTDGSGTFYEAQIVEVKKDNCLLELLSSEPWQRGWHSEITVAVSPTKSSDRMEWLLEKMVEVGIDRVVMLKTAHSERKTVNRGRLERVMVSAMKQSLKATLPALDIDVPLTQFITQTKMPCKLIAHCVDALGLMPRLMPNELYHGGDVCVMIGPEGDFTYDEVKEAEANGFRGLSLGSSRLRTETAGLYALQWVQILQEIKDKQ